MSHKSSRASLNFFLGSDGPTLELQIFEDGDLSSLRSVGIVDFASAVEDVVFVRLADERAPSRMVRRVRDSLIGPRFEFGRHKEGWLGCAELIGGLTSPGHQYLSRGPSDEAVVIVSYREPPTVT